MKNSTIYLALLQCIFKISVFIFTIIKLMKESIQFLSWFVPEIVYPFLPVGEGMLHPKSPEFEKVFLKGRK
jgi:hypothetical protein